MVVITRLSIIDIWKLIFQSFGLFFFGFVGQTDFADFIDWLAHRFIKTLIRCNYFDLTKHIRFNK